MKHRNGDAVAGDIVKFKMGVEITFRDHTGAWQLWLVNCGEKAIVRDVRMHKFKYPGPPAFIKDLYPDGYGFQERLEYLVEFNMHPALNNPQWMSAGYFIKESDK